MKSNEDWGMKYMTLHMREQEIRYEGRQEVMKKTISMLKTFKIAEKDIVDQLQKEFSITKEAAEKLVKELS